MLSFKADANLKLACQQEEMSMSIYFLIFLMGVYSQ